MAVRSDPDQVLDLLFNDSDGLLKSEVQGIQTVDFSDLGLFSEGDGDLLESVLKEANLGDLDTDIDIDQPQQKTFTTHTDHDYFAQRSPTNSDSGVSLESSAYSPQSFGDEQLQNSPKEYYLSDSSTNISTVDYMDKLSEHSPLALEDFNMKDFDMEGVDGLNTSDLLSEEDFLTCMNRSSQTKDSAAVTISLDDNQLNSSDEGSDVANTIRIIKVTSHLTDGLPFTMKDISTKTGKFPDLRLTDEEKDLLAREGVQLPTDMPLTKEEEKVLKAVRRKIRNKVSAKESRKRKQGYVEGLEKRVKMSTTENQKLKTKVSSLENQNQTLAQQLKKLQSYILSKANKPQTSTCIMVLVLSFAFIIVPNFSPLGKRDGLEAKNIPMAGKSRSLLHDYGYESEADLDDPYGIKVSMKPGPPWEVPPKTPAMKIPSNAHTRVEFEMDQSEEVMDKMADSAAQTIATQVEEKNDTVLKFKESHTVKEEI
ncbi:cyclic AMP-responsive element-binding protein 3-like protein 4 isoform X2 [Mizuhopecten yessoensis]|uniref:Cyclic AMP-responsive element-binding protein 3-like protein 3 n=1 Tax=Mizuhopecten yessoensis TaxID=6573 RepID=A0A210QGP9_MIZYE|nr:cyclic AMP-responsive element-binding protein 3-like protein 4 isoform X2 [Mizuhopecten yessoensis]OWF47934.1 Cyclic AMP-responsive element-binding protein 3-like protein 3 [Mizuhopecten yessoensis]